MLDQTQDTKALVPREGGKLNTSAKVLAIRQGKDFAAESVGHLTGADVKLMATVAGRGRHGDRDRLLIATLFDGCLRVSEALGIKPSDIVKTEDGYAVSVMGKGHKPGKVAISGSLASELMAYCYQKGIAKAYAMREKICEDLNILFRTTDYDRLLCVKKFDEFELKFMDKLTLRWLEKKLDKV